MKNRIRICMRQKKMHPAVVEVLLAVEMALVNLENKSVIIITCSLSFFFLRVFSTFCAINSNVLAAGKC